MDRYNMSQNKYLSELDDPEFREIAREIYKQSHNAYHREYRKKNPEKIKEIRKKNVQKNWVKYNERRKEYYRDLSDYKRQLSQRYDVLTGEMEIGNDSKELKEELRMILDEMARLKMIDQENYHDIMSLLP